MPCAGTHGHLALLAVGGEDALGRQQPGAAELRQQVDQAGAAEALRRACADGLAGEGAVRAEAHALDGAVGGRHAVAHQPALEGRPRRAGGREHAAFVLEHDLGVGAHVHQHRGACGGEALLQRHQRGCGVTADVARDQRQAIDAGRAVRAQAQPHGAGAERGMRPLAGEEGALDLGLVGLLADPLHVEPEEDVAHGGIGRDHDLVDRLAAQPEPGAALHDRAVDGGGGGLLQLLRGVFAVVRDAVHHVAAAEGLRVLEGGAVHALAGLQVDEVEHHGGGAEVEREPQHAPRGSGPPPRRRRARPRPGA